MTHKAARSNLQCVWRIQAAIEKGVTAHFVWGNFFPHISFPLNSHKVRNLIVMLMAMRNSFEIMAETLSLCKEPKTKTQIMYGANLSWRMLQKYLSKLQSKGLLEIQHNSTKYVTTRKGLEFVEKWGELIELL